MKDNNKEIVEEILNELITERWVKPDWLQYKEEMTDNIKSILMKGRKQFASELTEFTDMTRDYHYILKSRDRLTPDELRWTIEEYENELSKIKEELQKEIE